MPVGQAVIPVGGLGTRLGPLTRDMPKPLLDVGGRPFLLRLIDELRRHGVQDILLLAGFQADRVREAVRGLAGVTVLAEPEPMGTGGALVFAREALAERFFFLNGDSLFDVNLWDLALAHAGAGAPRVATLALRAVDDAGRYGGALLEGDTVVGFRERGQAGPGLINGGVAVFDHAILHHLPAAGACSIEGLVYPELARTGRLGGRRYDRPFIDIGVPDDFDRAPAWVRRHLTRGAVIFDRDGVLNVDFGYAHRPEHVEWIEGAIQAVKAVNDAGLFAFVATNQAGVARGYYGEAEVHALHAWMNEAMAAQGAHIDCFAHSPYHPEGTVEAFRRDSDCRKPRPGMLSALLASHDVDPARTVMVGDKLSDMEAAAAAGVRGLLFEGGDLMARVKPLIAELSAARSRSRGA